MTWSRLLGALVLAGASMPGLSQEAARTDIPPVPWGGMATAPKVVYGTDDRIDVYQETDAERLGMAASTCALVSASALTNNGNGTYTLAVSSYRELGLPACGDEPFGSQPVGAFCTGFMVGEDVIATAGHCMDSSDMSSARFVFGFVMEDAATVNRTFNSNEVYTAVEILGHALGGDLDYTIARVDRKITAPGARALPIRRTGAVTVGTPVGVIGHPAGLPMKIAFGASTAVRSVGPAGYFVANTDTYGGNSGSPVFNQETGVVEGILVRGENDYVNAGSCFRSNTVSNTGGRGEDVSKTTSFEQFVPVEAGSAGTLTADATAVRCGNAVTLTVLDADLDGAASAVVTVNINGGDSEAFVLAPVLNAAGTFRREVTLNAGVAVPGNGTVELAEGATVVFTYRDADNGSGQAANVTAQVALDCTPPTASTPSIEEIGSAQATVVLETSEPAAVTVHFGLFCNALTLSANSGMDTAHALVLNGLTALTRFYFTVEIADAAGNVTTLDNGGDCFVIDTAEPVDYLTQQFVSGAGALEGRQLLFTPANNPDGYVLCTRRVSAFDTAPGGTELVLDDDSQAPVPMAGGKVFPFFGVEYSEVYVCANGFITFENADEAYQESIAQHFKFRRLSAFFRDLSPNLRGTVSYGQTSDRVAITFEDVPGFTQGTPAPENSNTFQIELFFDGRIQLTYLNIFTSAGLVGLSRGGGVPIDFVASNLLGYRDCDNPDDDIDGLPDNWERRAGLNPESSTGDDGANGDPDEDGLSNLQEYQAGTNPHRADSDFDGVSDADELAGSTDPTGAGVLHDTDTDHDGRFSIDELMRVIQFYNSDGFHCASGTEDGFAPDGGPRTCLRHHSDYVDPAFEVEMQEILRAIQFYNSRGYTRDVLTEDSFTPR